MIPQAESDAGLSAYEQVQAFAALRRKKLGLVYVLFPILLVVMGGMALAVHAPIAGAICIASAFFFVVFAAWNWHTLSARDGKNRALLADLRARYGEDLPWLQVERQMAEIRKIEAEKGYTPPPDDEED